MSEKPKFAVICASNMNRSMEGHYVLSKRGFNVCSFGTGTMVRLPGPSADKPNVYPFGTPYDQIYKELERKDPHLYTQNGMLHMLDRNRKTKPSPERFHDTDKVFDVIVTCEERVFDAVLEGQNNKPVHVINFEIRDTPQDAAIGARKILEFCQLIENCADLETEMDSILEEFQKNSRIQLLHSVAYF